MLETLAPGWYLLCYHDIGWQEPRHLHGMAICHPPDCFLDHLALCSALGDIVSFEEGCKRIEHGRVDRPMFTLSFDDGYRGVVEHALPALDRIGITGVAAINSDFIGAGTTYWRSQLCWIRHTGMLAGLIERLETVGYVSGSVRDFTMDFFNEEILGIIEDVYESTEPAPRELDRQRMHLTYDDVARLDDRGWTIANHSARHLPLLEESASAHLESEFDRCETALEAVIGHRTELWVAPFDRPLQRSASAVTRLRSAASGRRVALVADRATTASDVSDSMIYRVFAPMAGEGALLERLRRASRRTKRTAPHRSQT